MRRNNKKGKRHRKRYDVLEVSISLKQMVNVWMDLVSIARSHHNGGMPVGECVDELLSSGHVEESNQLNLFVLWSFWDKENRALYCATKTPYFHFKFVDYCFDWDNKGFSCNMWALLLDVCISFFASFIIVLLYFEVKWATYVGVCVQCVLIAVKKCHTFAGNKMIPTVLLQEILCNMIGVPWEIIETWIIFPNEQLLLPLLSVINNTGNTMLFHTFHRVEEKQTLIQNTTSSPKPA